MPHRGSHLALAIACLVSACSTSDGPPPLTAPRTGTDFVLYATAPAGRAALASAVIVARATDVSTFRPDPIGGGDVDVFFAGLRAEDLPEGLDPTKLEIVPKNELHAHALPKLYAPHVLERTGPFDARLSLVPADDPSLPSGVLADRAERLRKMVENLAVRDPCEEPLTPFTITTPRTAGEEIRAFRTLSSGETWVGLTITSTIMLGVLHDGSLEMESVSVMTSTTPLARGDRVRVFDLGDAEVTNHEGRVVPAELALSFIGAFGGVGQVVSWAPSLRRWDDDTPETVDAQMNGVLPSLLSGTRHLTLGGEPSLCTFGQVRGPNRVGGIWCRTTTSTTWTVSAQVRDAFTMFEVMERPGKEPIAFDVAGTVYVHEARGWRPVAKPAVNEGCSPPCVTFAGRVGRPTTSTDGLLAVVGGSDATVIAVWDRGGDDIEITTITAVSSVLFADERDGAEQPIRFATAEVSPDGAIWLGTSKPVLVRVSPDRTTARRICLPDEVEGNETTALHALESGTLYVGMTPAVLGFGDWRE